MQAPALGPHGFHLVDTHPDIRVTPFRCQKPVLFKTLLPKPDELYSLSSRVELVRYPVGIGLHIFQIYHAHCNLRQTAKLQALHLRRTRKRSQGRSFSRKGRTEARHFPSCS